MKFQVLMIVLLQGLYVTIEQMTQANPQSCLRKMDTIICTVNERLTYVNAELQDLKNKNTATQNNQLEREFNKTIDDLNRHIAGIEETQRKIIEITKHIESRISNLEHRYSTNFSDNNDHDPPLNLPHDCSEVKALGNSMSGIYSIYPGIFKSPVHAFCDMESNGGGWTVIQRRLDGSTDFFRNWTDYKTGFGDLQREFWLGNDIISDITTNNINQLSNVSYSLLVTLTNFSNGQAFAEYQDFRVAPEVRNYTLNLEFVGGSAGDSLSFHNGMPFSTSDIDNDADRHGNCASHWNSGGFWFRNCFYTCLNCPYSQTEIIQYGRGITWLSWLGLHRSLKGTEMKIRPLNFAG